MDWTKSELDFLSNNSHLSIYELSNKLGRSYDSVGNKLKRIKTKIGDATMSAKDKRENDVLREQILIMERERDAYLKLQEKPEKIIITSKESKGTSEVTPIIVASDWHIEERVKSSTVNGLNSFNLKTAEQRSVNFFRNASKLIKIQENSSKVNTVILALLGDFISGSIHDELMENNQLQPADAIWKAQSFISSGIEFLLKQNNHELIIPCHSGNHGRLTAKQRHSTESGNSLEVLMYKSLQKIFSSEPRIKFVIPDSYYSFIKVYNTTIRLHHGHNIKFNGGTGGIGVPFMKAASQWNKARHADLDIAGHYHYLQDGGFFLINGSLIGWSPFGIHVKGSYQRPQQLFTSFHSQYGRCGYAPIWLD